MKSIARFSVDPRLSALLGESYTSSERALRELVDNAWRDMSEGSWFGKVVVEAGVRCRIALAIKVHDIS